MKRTAQRLFLPMLLLTLTAATATAGNGKEVAGRVTQHDNSLDVSGQGNGYDNWWSYKKQ